MTKEIIINAHVTEEINNKIEQLATLTQRSKSWHIVQALKHYITYEIH